MQIFSKEYNFVEKILGKGFNFLNWYGFYFMHDKTVSDWPHNPFISVLLYSGIAGFLLYLFFFYRINYLYLKYPEYYDFYIFFMITFFFAFFSAGSPFDPPVMGYFMLMPFFFNKLNKQP
jgi:O-antigen ligase